LIDARFRGFRKAGRRLGPDSQPADYHRLRIRGKRLRYALEFVSDVYAEQTRPLIKRLVALQDVLGLHQDADVAIRRLRQLAVDTERPLETRTAFAMGEVAERYRQSMIELRRDVPHAYARVSGKAWRAFRKAMERQKPSDVGDEGE
jgi:CHAD domain-containing protein